MERKQLLVIMAAIIYAGTASGKKKNEADAVKTAKSLLEAAEIESQRDNQ